MTEPQVLDNLIKWEKTLPAGTCTSLETTWKQTVVENLSDRVTVVLTKACPSIKKINDLFQSRKTREFAELKTQIASLNKTQNDFVQNHLLCYYGVLWAKERNYDNAYQTLKAVRASDIVQPYFYYFYKSVCEKELRLKEEALLSIHRLMQIKETPERYAVIAVMMEGEISKWDDKEDKIGDIARRMREIEARLDNAQGGAKTQERQKEVVKMLDEEIKSMEQQMQQQNQASAGGQKQQQQQMPASDSKIMNGAGQGEVDKKKLIITSEVWGKMPEKEKVKALEAVNRILPAHIREAAEGFSKKLQQSGGRPPSK